MVLTKAKRAPSTPITKASEAKFAWKWFRRYQNAMHYSNKRHKEAETDYQKGLYLGQYLAYNELTLEWELALIKFFASLTNKQVLVVE